MLARSVAIGVAMLLWCSCASAQRLGFLPDPEPGNNSVTEAPLLQRYDTAALTGVLHLGFFDFDYFQVTLDPHQVLTLVTMPLSPSMSTPDTVITISNSAGTYLIEDDDGGVNSSGVPAHGSVVRFRAPTFDRYQVEVRGYDEFEVGDYAMLVAFVPDGLDAASSAEFLTTEPNDTPATAQPLALPWCGPLTGIVLLGQDDADYLSVDLRAGDLLTAVTTPIDLAGAILTFDVSDTVMTVFKPDGVTVLAESDDDEAGEYPPPSNVPRGSTVRARAPFNGRYYIRVRGFFGAPGSSLLAVCVIPASLKVCESDINGDGVVNASDLGLMLGGWGVCP